MSSRRPFRQVAQAFVGLLEDPPPDISLALLQRALLELYFAALSLESDEGEETDDEPVGTISPRWLEVLQEHRFYWEVFDPTVEEPPVAGDLVDDISDIHRDLRRALASDGDWSAWFSFRIHWGAHAADALRALHSINIGMNA